MDVNFTNKVVLITGAGGGIGGATALLFAKLGARLSLVDRNEVNLRNVADKCEKENGLKPLAIFADLGTDAGVEKTAEETIEHFGRYGLHAFLRKSVLIDRQTDGQSDIGVRACIQHTDMATYDEVFNINVRSVYNLTRLLVPHLLNTKGNIINVSSIMVSNIAVGSLPYDMAKTALDHFTKVVALELAPQGVRVNTVSPGLTVSNATKTLMRITEEEYQTWLKNTVPVVPMGKACVGLDVARMIVHLASDNSRLVTGTIVQVDGGLQFGSIGNLMIEQMKALSKSK